MNHTDFLKHPYRREATNIDFLYAAHGERDFGNPVWEKASARFLILRLSPFRDVERSTPHEFLYREVRQALPGAYIDFGFFPTTRDRAALECGSVPLMHGIASARGAADFDVLLVSNAYTLEMVNLAPYLAGSGLLPTRTGRDSAPPGTRYPIVALGGSNAMASAALYDEATGDSLVDAIFFGEGEGSVGPLAVHLAAASRLQGEERLAALVAAARAVPGFWPTAIRMPVVQTKARAEAYPGGQPPVLAGEESGTSRLEITRGCLSFCTFCFEGWERKPFRERSLASIMAEARRLKAGVGIDSIELASYNFNAHSRVVDIIKTLHEVFWSVSFQSQRVDILARSPGLIKFEVAAGKRTFTIGVEGISTRVRAYYNKELHEADLRAVLERIVREGAREIKLFYILSGFEGDADLAEFTNFIGWLRNLTSERPAAPRIMFSAGELIRMPFTPLAYERLILDEAPYLAIRARFEAVIAGAGFEYRSPERFDEYCLSQVLALPPAGSLALLLALSARGHVYDRNLSRGAWDFTHAWLEERGVLSRRGIDAQGIDPQRFETATAYLDEKPRDYLFPYAFVTPIATRDIVYNRFLDARQARERVSCLGASCAGCGACDDDSELAFLSAHELDTATERDLRDIEAIVAAKRKPHETFVRAKLPREAALAPPAYSAVGFRRQLFATAPALLDTVWTASDSFLKSKDGLARLPGAWGDTQYRLLSSRPLDPDQLTAAGYVVSDTALAPDRLSAELTFPIARFAETVRLVSDFMTAAAMPFTLRKTEVAATFLVAQKGRKKRNVLEATVAVGPEGGVIVKLVCGGKYDLGALAALAGKRTMVYETSVSL